MWVFNFSFVFFFAVERFSFFYFSIITIPKVLKSTAEYQTPSLAANDTTAIIQNLATIKSSQSDHELTFFRWQDIFLLSLSMLEMSLIEAFNSLDESLVGFLGSHV